MSHLTIRPSFMELHLLPTLTTLIPIQATSQERRWRGARELHWVPPPGVLGVATGAIGVIAIGTTVTSTSITTIILTGMPTETPLGTSIAAKLARATDGNITRNTVGMRLMGTGKRRINSAVRALVEQAALEIAEVAPGEPAGRAALAERAA